jgi:hypothetical protein
MAVEPHHRVNGVREVASAGSKNGNNFRPTFLLVVLSGMQICIRRHADKFMALFARLVVCYIQKRRRFCGIFMFILQNNSM